MLFQTKNPTKNYSNCGPSRGQHRQHRRFHSPFSASISANIREDAEAFFIDLLAPGRNKDAFKLKLNKNQLTVSYTQNTENEDAQKFTHQEFRLNDFERRFVLPASVDSEKIEATYESGILRIKLAKREEAKDQPPKEISIK